MRARFHQRPNRSEGPCVSGWRFDRLPLKQQCFRIPVCGQILPCGFMDSTSLFFFSLRHPLISFSRAMAINYTLKPFKIDQPMTFVLARETLDQIIFVLEHTATQSRSDAGIKRTARAAAHHIKVRSLLHWKNARSLRATRALKKTRAPDALRDDVDYMLAGIIAPLGTTSLLILDRGSDGLLCCVSPP